MLRHLVRVLFAEEAAQAACEPGVGHQPGQGVRDPCSAVVGDDCMLLRVDLEAPVCWPVLVAPVAEARDRRGPGSASTRADSSVRWRTLDWARTRLWERSAMRGTLKRIILKTITRNFQNLKMFQNVLEHD
jgi:hypothetical protein